MERKSNCDEGLKYQDKPRGSNDVLPMRALELPSERSGAAGFDRLNPRTVPPV